MAKNKILVIDDEKDILDLVEYNLKQEGYKVSCVMTGEEALDAASSFNPDLIILDLMLPGLDGFEVCKILKRDEDTQEIPIIMLTAKGEDVDVVTGLELGADDYITKPFEAEELVLRINNILRRSGKSGVGSVQMGHLEIKFDELIITDPENQFQMTQREGELLKYLIDNRNRLLRREEILKNLWGKDDYFLGRSMDVFISRLRKYLKTEESISLETVRGIGFILKSEI